MERLPENIRMVLDGLLEDLKSRESISGIGLFGSWSRGDAVSSSDVDLLVVDSRDFDYEHVERAEIENHFLDLDYIPQKWILKRIPPEIDQKLYEAQVLYDCNGTLTKAKDLMLKIYWKPERVEIRTENYLMEGDIYLSRAISAYNKDDFQSAKVNAAIGLESILKILIEINKLPISNSHFITALEESSKKLDMHKFYEEYAEITGLSKLDRQKTENMLDSFLAMWKETVDLVEPNSSTVEKLHMKVKNSLNYYCKESFLKGMSARADSLIKDKLFAEAAHYMSRTSVDMLENYAWLLSIMEGTRFDYTVLFQHLRDSKTSPEEVYQKAVEAFGIEEVSGREAADSLDRAREIILSVRQRRRELITSLSSQDVS